MNIQVLDPVTIDKIAAGEVVERPASVVKELAENAIDAGATTVTVEIQDGGISLIRVSDDGCGIPTDQIRAAFFRHSTSKIRTVSDLGQLSSLGFRGEALSSIAAVAQVEALSRTQESEVGCRYRIHGGVEESLEDAAVPKGTTFLIRQLFYNVPARKKFLKTPMTEAGHINELLMRLALSHPEISFRFLNNGQTRIHTSGNGRLCDVIYHLYGREIAANLIDVDLQRLGIRVHGFLGAPVISRGNRNFETFFINQRYVKNAMISRSIEDAYRDFSMQHKFPFVVLQIDMDTACVDVNVHPAKLEVRFDKQQQVYDVVYEAVSRGLHEKEQIPEATIDEAPKPEKPPQAETPEEKEKFGGDVRGSGAQTGASGEQEPEKRDLNYFMEAMRRRVESYHAGNSSAEVRDISGVFRPQMQTGRIRETVGYPGQKEKAAAPQENPKENQQQVQSQEQSRENPPEQPRENAQGQTHEQTQGLHDVRQMDLFADRLLDHKEKPNYRLIGQLFETYWLLEYNEQLYIIDQHAAHERVLYERTLRGLKNRSYTSQMISPPMILNLTMQEAQLLEAHMEQFARIGFEIEAFGTDAYAVRAVPDNLFSIAKKELLMEMLDDLQAEYQRNHTTAILDEKIASMSCKAAVKGNMRLSAEEMDALIGELLLLENPYHCPHGRPTMISISKRELEKKFKRIV